MSLTWLMMLFHYGDKAPLAGQTFEITSALSSSHSMLLLPETVDYLNELKDRGFELVVVSDSNDIYIRSVLAAAGVESLFSKIYTNTAEVVPSTPLLESASSSLPESSRNPAPSNEAIVVHPLFSTPPQCPTGCGQCTSTMCKGCVIEAYLNENPQARDHPLFYFGDGSGDLCACLSLLKTINKHPPSAAMTVTQQQNDSEPPMLGATTSSAVAFQRRDDISVVLFARSGRNCSLPKLLDKNASVLNGGAGKVLWETQSDLLKRIHEVLHGL
ncbi:pyridoxal phosphate phosphatase PHOSPHO2 [Pelomyxa schiedti]|nr:pyridoxal phosphate phosphatase PHOSPHO2 [Pelomyxa schiedti]